jgi:hypothetical protein
LATEQRHVAQRQHIAVVDRELIGRDDGIAVTVTAPAISIVLLSAIEPPWMATPLSVSVLLASTDRIAPVAVSVNVVRRSCRY